MSMFISSTLSSDFDSDAQILFQYLGATTHDMNFVNKYAFFEKIFRVVKFN